MEFPRTLLELAGSVALLLWGVHMVQTGVQRAWGARLRTVLGQALRNRFAAFAAGLGVTALLQSSTATGLMVTGFAAGGMVDLVPALAVMLGANVGTTLIVQALSFDVSFLSPALVLGGVLAFRRADAAATRDVGRVLIGLGLMLLALRQLLDIVTPYEDTPSLRLLLGALASEPLLDVLVGAVLAWAAHSSVAIVLLVMSLAAKGVLPLAAAFALVLGANLGTAINPVLEGSGADPVARRVPLGNFASRVLGVVVTLAVLPRLAPVLAAMPGDAARLVADFHTLFNLVLATLLFPLLPAYARLLRRLLPARVDPADPARPLYLDAAARETPVVALGGAAREALRLADVLEAMLAGLAEGLARADRRRLAEARRLDDVLDRLTGAIRGYLSGLDGEAMSEADHRRVTEILTFVINMEHAGDVVDRNLLVLANRALKRGRPLTPAQQDELAQVLQRVGANLRMAAALFLSEDPRLARLLAEEKPEFRRIEAEAAEAHFAAMRAGEATEISALHLDLLRDLRRVNAHLVAAAAYPVLETHGELLPSRLRRDD
ncbi:Na/Pi cotransporter family protein [Rhodovastum atsumiense]|uniref:Na/Pi cotransporter family protein n=1 Tax=Rhodovastum atsumiense TaxID=504468 RepID=A0A5M6INZ5_9PROT|nr:Na/Pi cotransporter family protein [Rhodovastum atsumiense]KAA5609980.1 Na/Pi cotransporter family protein [Rhodovastum atsumiense]CAH2598620.1 Na/Pi cotransporter family protein [Rhodovastum atsumiense]